MAEFFLRENILKRISEYISRKISENMLKQMKIYPKESREKKNIRKYNKKNIKDIYQKKFQNI